MIDDDAEKKRIAILTACVYFVQGALGISAIALPIYLRRLGWSVGQITGIASVAAFPWVVKVIYGFLTDSIPLFGYRRKPYLYIYLACSVFGWLILSLWGNAQWHILISLWIANLGFAGTDVITDSLVVENSKGKWGHLYQSISWTARSSGAVLTGMLGGWLMTYLQPVQLFRITAFLPLLALPPLLLFHEARATEKLSLGELRDKCREIFSFTVSRRTLAYSFFLFCCVASACFGTPFFFYMKESLYFQEDYLGFLVSLGWVGTILGSIAYGIWMKNTELGRLLKIVIVVNLINILSTYGVLGVNSAAALIFFGGIATGLILPPLMTGAANLSSGSGVEGTLFAVLTGLFNLSQLVWGWLGGKMLPFFGLYGLIGFSAVIQMVAIFAISAIKIPSQHENLNRN